ncbi:hypothetical protein UFOVP275_21 [uncultured Caudovirales phage]|uniref:Uncharacterized protein n=1 Tax=uncultured Caudovirales phage TaxID=2100421 RepID=A0A6J5LJQ0_9CAUD|nr:hypothetical protein UFOVP275_21 [uncultured Caudovirales phage]
MSILLILFYCFGIQYERGGWWRVFSVIAVVGLVIDVIANYTELAIVTGDFPRKGEWTFSKRLRRLQQNNDWRGDFARYIGGCLDKIAPSGKHI